MKDRAKRNRTTAEWSDSDYILPAGLVGYDTETNRHKYGNGVDVWDDLPYPNLGGPTGSLLVVDDEGAVKDLDGNTVSVGGGGGSVDPAEVESIVDTKLQAAVPTNRLLPDPSGAGIGDLLTVPTPGTPSWTSPDPLSKYRGAWSSSEELQLIDFAATLSPFTSHSAGGTNINSSAATRGLISSLTGQANTPAWTHFVSLGPASSSAGREWGITVNPSALSLGGKTPTHIKFHEARYQVGIPSAVCEVVDGTTVRSSVSIAVSGAGTKSGWSEKTVAYSGGNPLLFKTRTTSSTESDSKWYIAGLRIFGAAAPYMRGDVVDHLGSLYRSELNENGNTPGSHVSWTLINA